MKDWVGTKSLLRKERKAKKQKHKWSDRWPAVVTREGKGFLWLTVGVAFAALNTGNNLLYLVLSFMLSLLLLSMLLAESGIRSLTVERLQPQAAFARETTVLRYRIRGKKRWLPVFAVEVREQHPGVVEGRPAWVAKVGATPEPTEGHVLFPKRGPVTLRTLQVRTSFPFGLVEKRRWFVQEQTLLVYPYPGRGVSGSLDVSASLGEQRALHGVRSEMGDLREYVPGDPIRTVHWLRSASLGELIARDQIAQRRPDWIVDLAHGLPERDEKTWRSAIEARIGGATRVVLDAAHDAMGVRLRYGQQEARLVAGGPTGAALAFLAQLEPEQEAT